jgi:hypothetical protein
MPFRRLGGVASADLSRQKTRTPLSSNAIGLWQSKRTRTQPHTHTPPPPQPLSRALHLGQNLLYPAFGASFCRCLTRSLSYESLAIHLSLLLARAYSRLRDSTTSRALEMGGVLSMEAPRIYKPRVTKIYL